MSSTTTDRAGMIEGILAAALRPENTTGGEDTVKIRVCAGTTCNASGRAELTAALRDELARRDLTDKVRVVETGCHGLCQEGPIVVVHPRGIFYPRLKARDIKAIVETSVVADDVVERLLYRDPATDTPIALEKDIPFYARQVRLARGVSGYIEPTSIDDYLSRGGYAALAKVLVQDDPMAVIDEVDRAGLRGRGGGGFPAGKKWRYCRGNPGDKHYIICNGDEGDPGAFMDRALLEDNPHSVLEGMLVAAFAIGADEGHIYVRHEYPLAVERLLHGMQQARERRLLGDDIMGTGWNFDISITQGAGAFVCGESTALTASIEGQRGMPRGKHIRTVAQGLYGQPTSLNNVETYATVPWIINHGAEAFAAMGTETSKGTKIFSLTGTIVNSGLVEVPMGATLREVIFDIAGGVPAGHEFKAVQLGGPSGGCLPAALLDSPVDFESLLEAGSMMGSGGMVVVDDSTCMVDFAKFFLQFTQNESCGKCVPCRLGTKRMLETLVRITDGEGRPGDIELLEELSEYIMDGSLCALGGSAPNPVLSTLRYFRDEYVAHVNDKCCPAGRCKALITYYINGDCTGCGLCAKKCPTKAITGEKKQIYVIDEDLCIKCDTCRQVCNFNAVKVRSGVAQPGPTDEGRQGA
jgi:NADH:ubiquinone oxidoreductase subunit F (NADH-binding)/(2Fe-2S) ferredoxin/Pyruvate/2-oxoacid:ferredoxin oxidoreductase delta subunit